MQGVDALDGLALLCRTSSGEVVAPPRFLLLRALCGEEKLNTENTETLCVLCSEALKALSTQRSLLCLRLCGTAKPVQTITLRPAIIEFRSLSFNSDS